jgi:hypothetical protein
MEDFRGLDIISPITVMKNSISGTYIVVTTAMTTFPRETSFRRRNRRSEGRDLLKPLTIS